MSENGITIQDFLQMYQIINGQFSSLVGVMSYFVTALGVITAVIIGFFAVRQWNVDREIRKYKDDLRKQRDDAIKIVQRINLNHEKSVKKIKEIDKTLSKEINKPMNKQTEQELQKLRKDLEKIKSESDFNKGALSVFPKLTYEVARSVGPLEINSNDFVYDNIWSAFQERCKNCGRGYNNSFEILNHFSVAGENINKSKCPYCGNIN